VVITVVSVWYQIRFFNPLVAGAGGPFSVIYTYTDRLGCITKDTAETSVSALPTVILRD
jgi:hypothetical protein